ncbi:MAG: DUF3180 domain-containing protein [Dermatophilaceae bacterium]
MKAEVRTQALAVVAGVAFAVAFVVFALLIRDGSLVPVPPVAAGALLLLIAAAVLALARQVRRHTRGGTWIEPLRAARTVVLAQAAALTGAAAVGWYTGQLAVVAGDLSLLANRDRLLPLGLHLVAASLLVVAGLVAQHWCRVDRDDNDDDGWDATRRRDGDGSSHVDGQPPRG